MTSRKPAPIRFGDAPVSENRPACLPFWGLQGCGALGAWNPLRAAPKLIAGTPGGAGAAPPVGSEDSDCRAGMAG